MEISDFSKIGEDRYDDDNDIDSSLKMPSIYICLYNKLRSYLFHYNTVKLKYKTIALTWLGAVFIGIGYVLSGEGANMPLHESTIVLFICVISSIGEYLFWFLDIGIYHHEVDIIYIETLDLECALSKLSMAHNLMIDFTAIGNRFGPVIFDGLYYIPFILLLLVIGCFSLYITMSSQGVIFAVIITTAASLLSLAIIWILISRTLQAAMLKKKMIDFV